MSDKKFLLYAVQDLSPEMTGADIASASYFVGISDEIVVNMELKTSTGANKHWASWTTDGVGKYAGISVDGVIYSFPVINSPITGGYTQISGGFSLEEAEDLAGILSVGALPIPAIIVEDVK